MTQSSVLSSEAVAAHIMPGFRYSHQYRCRGPLYLGCGITRSTTVDSELVSFVRTDPAIALRGIGIAVYRYESGPHYLM